MFIFFGTREFGKVDRIKNVGFVTTKFFHINLVPLVPLCSYFVLGKSSEQGEVIALPMSLKSIFTNDSPEQPSID